MLACKTTARKGAANMTSSRLSITQMLDAAAAGEPDAANELFGLVYDELRQLAGHQMKQESISHTLQSTALVHEVWIKLVGDRNDQSWQNRSHFFAAAAQAMRRILVDAARARKRIKRGGGKAKLEIRDDDLVSLQDEELIALDEALELLQADDDIKARLVDLRFFAGFTNAQASEQLGLSTATGERYWAFAKAWLRNKIES